MKNKLVLPDDIIPPLIPFEVEVPNMCLVTGRNGTGKTRLLQAIASGAVQFVSSKFGRLDRNEIVLVADPSREDPFSGNGRSNLVTLEALCAVHEVANHRSLARAIGVVRQLEDRGPRQGPNINRRHFDIVASRYSSQEDIEFKNDEEKAKFEELFRQIDTCVGELSEAGVSVDKADIAPLVYGRNPYREASKHRISIDSPLSLHIQDHMQDWVLRCQTNEYRRFLAYRGKVQASYLGDEEFIAVHGPPPWDLIDEQFSRLGMEIKVHVNKDAAYDKEQQLGEIELVDRAGNRYLPSGLSSGERILIKVALIRYAQTNDNIIYRKPRLIVFDEPDAHLHPALAG